MAAPPKYKTYKKQVKLGAGQQLHFTPGKGYWAGPKIGPTGAPPKPIDPFAPLSPAVLGTQATTQANAALAPEKAEIERQRALAAARAKADQGAMLGLATTVAEMQKGLVPGAAAPYAAAAGQIGDLAQGFSAGVAERLAAGQGANAEFAAGQGAQATPAVDPTAVKDVAYGLGGFVPGAALAAQGAAAGAYAAAIPAITSLALAGDYKKALFEAASQDDEYAQQLIQVAAKFPDMRNQALEALRKYEMDKAGYKLDVRQQAVQERAQSLYERQFNETARGNRVEEKQTQQEINLRKSQLQLDRQKLQLDSAQAVVDAQEAIAEGRQIDASASKVLGYIVDKQGREVLGKNGKRIRVKPTAAGSGTAEERNPYGAAVEAAKTLRGDPVKPADFVKHPKTGKLAPPRGRYMTRRGVKGGFPDGTTNDPSRAQYESQYTFAEAVGFLQARYNISRAQARKALIASGWKPDGVRPKK